MPHLFDIFWKSGAVLGIALCASLLLRNKSADLRRLILSTAIIALFIAALLAPLLPPLKFARPAAPVATLHVPVVDLISAQPAPESHLPPPTQQPTRSFDLTPFLVPAIWLAGAAALLIRFALNLRALRRLLKTSTPISCIVRRTETFVAPITWGVLRPIILVPANFETLSREHQDAILCHEFAHIRSRDFLMRTLAEIARALIWFQPLIWIVRRRLHEEQELACDNRVLASGGKPSAYAKLLLNWDTHPAMDSLVAVGMAHRSCLKRRLYALLDPHLRRESTSKTAMAAVCLFALAITLPLAAVSFAQSPAPQPAAGPKPKFDVASIKPCQPGDGPGRGGAKSSTGFSPNMPEGVGGSFRATPGRLDAVCASIMTMINNAYLDHGTQLLNNSGGPGKGPEQVRGIPKWALSTRYTIHAETDDPTANQSDVHFQSPAAMLLYGTMLQSLLEDRFHLKLHRESEDAPLYALTVAKSGPKIKPMHDGDCIPDGPPEWPKGGKPACHWIGRETDGPNDVLLGGGIPLTALVSAFSDLFLDRHVIDRTGLTAEYVFRLEFAPNENTPCMGPPRICQVDPNSAIPAAPAIFTALEQQLGLKLESIKGPREYIVIDRVDAPTEN